jgi:[amino group carrier protein]-lysine/ornithine hydrolase
VSAPDRSSTVALAEQEARDVELLRGLVAIPSLSGQERAAVEYLRDCLAARGFEASVDGAGNAVGVLGDGPREVVLLGHIDTVPGEIPVRIEDGVLHGRGAVDAKGPLATFVCAASRAAEAGLRGLRIVVIGAVGEEAESDGAFYVAPRYRPDFCVIGEPGGWDSVVLGYKGSLSGIYTLRKPGGHSAGPTATAPQVAVDFWNRYLAYATMFNAGRSRGFDTLDPTLRAFNTGTDGLYDTVELRFGTRLPLDVDGAAVIAQLRDFARTDLPDGAEAAIETNQPLPAYRGDKNNPLVRALLAAIRAEGGMPRFKTKTGTADMNIIGPAWGCPTVAYGPGDSSLDHTPHERIELAEYLRAVAVLAGALKQLGETRQAQPTRRS